MQKCFDLFNINALHMNKKGMILKGEKQAGVELYQAQKSSWLDQVYYTKLIKSRILNQVEKSSCFLRLLDHPDVIHL